MMKDKNYEVSVIVLTYNPDWIKFKDTLLSILCQKKISLQIVVSDDGSEENCFEQARDFFQKKCFTDYKLLPHGENAGIVRNVHAAVSECNGEWVKLISPGDSLIGNDSLRRWVDFLKISGNKWSFCDAVYYHYNQEGMKEIIVDEARPVFVKPYERKNDLACRWNYLVLNDLVLGASTICEREMLKNYIERIKDKIIYAEDNIYRLMMFDGAVGLYFPYSTVFYERGTGISTSANNTWSERISRDWEAANEIMFSGTGELDEFQKKVKRACEINVMKFGFTKLWKQLFMKDKLKYTLLFRFCKRLSPDSMESNRGQE